MVNIHGLTVDYESRCTHYHTPLDIIAIKFKCCNKFYSCYKCHNENENHEIIRWEKDEFMNMQFYAVSVIKQCPLMIIC